MQAETAHAALGAIGARFDHAAHAVPSVRSALPIYRDLLGGVAVMAGINPWGGHLAVQFGYPGGGKVELLEPVRDDAPSVGAFLARNPRGGLHHLTFKVDDVEEAVGALRAAGLEPFGTLLSEPTWHETYLHPRQTGGVLIQLAWSPPGSPPPLDRPLEEILDQAEAMRRAHRGGS